MIFDGVLPAPKRVNIFGVNYSIVDYESASDLIIKKAVLKESFGVSALAVHGLIESYKCKALLQKVNSLDLIVPDGQPVRWVMNNFHNAGLKDRVAGPELTYEVFKKANSLGLSVFFYGSTKDTLDRLVHNISTWFPKIRIVGVHIDRFRDSTPEEDEMDIRKINESGANLLMVGRGCPRQEVWVANHKGKINAVMMAVGAAFSFHAGVLPKAPKWMQKNGIEWCYRLFKEPKRLWRRYLFTNTLFIYLFIKYKLKHK